MKKPLSLLAITLLFGATINVNTSLDLHAVKAEEQIVQTYAYDQMVILSSSISGGDVTNENSDPKNLIDYGFRHGNVETGNLEMFETFGTNRLGVEGSLAAAFLNWKMQTANNDGAIIKFTANEKVLFSVSRENLGHDWKDSITLSIYKENTLLVSKPLADGQTTAEDFSFNCILEKDETLYWQILSPATDGPRLIAMGDAGDYSTLPVFTITEYKEYPKTDIAFNDLVNNYIAANQPYLKDNGNLFSYSFQYGNVEANTFNNGVVASNTLTLDRASIDSNGIKTLDSYANIILVLKAENRLKVVLTWNQDLLEYENIAIKYYLRGSKTKLACSLNEINEENIANLSKNFVVDYGNEIIINIQNTSNDVLNDLSLLESLSFEQTSTNSSIASDYPMYSKVDYSNATSITHKEIAFESAKLGCKPITLKDGTISLLTGKVNETEGENLRKFDTIKYDDGVYLYNQNVTPSMTLAGPNGTFNSDDQAVVEDYRLQTSIAEGVVYKFEASVNTQLKVTHPAIDGGWVGGKIFIEGLQHNQKVYKSINKEYVENAVAEADTFAITYNLKAGDVSYYVFGSEEALRRNLNIAPTFTTSTSDYDYLAREEIFGPTVVEATLYQTVTDTINNNYEPVTYEETLTIGLYHGTVEEKSLFTKHSGSGNGSADDAIFASNGVDSDAGFQRWQFHAGIGQDNAIMEFKAERDLKLNLTHKEMGTLFYNEGASLRYYISDTDGFFEYKEERYLSKDTPIDFYGYSISLKQGQSLVIEFTANDPEGYAVASIEWVAAANPTGYVLEETNDFTDARELDQFKKDLIDDATEYVNNLNEADYSLSNFAKIEQYLQDFIFEIKTLTDREEILELYNETIANIDDVLTLDEEQTILNNAKEAAIKEAEDYINSKRSTFTKGEWEEVLIEFEGFKRLVNLETSPTNINVLLIQFKATIDAMPATQEAKTRTTIIICSCAGGLLVLAGVLVPLIIIKKKKKGK